MIFEKFNEKHHKKAWKVKHNPGMYGVGEEPRARWNVDMAQNALGAAFLAIRLPNPGFGPSGSRHSWGVNGYYSRFFGSLGCVLNILRPIGWQGELM
jgi:hypothetical protein